MRNLCQALHLEHLPGLMLALLWSQEMVSHTSQRPVMGRQRAIVWAPTMEFGLLLPHEDLLLLLKAADLAGLQILVLESHWMKKKASDCYSWAKVSPSQQ